MNRNLQFTPAALAQLLHSAGTVLYLVAQRIMIPKAYGMFVGFPCFGTETKHRKELGTTLSTIGNFPQNRIREDYVNQLIHAIQDGQVRLPVVEVIGDRPTLVPAEGDKLYWPDFGGYVSRFVEPLKLYYTGPAVTPHRNGAFDEFLRSCRCITPEDTEILRAYMLSALVQGNLMGPGSYPILVLTSTKHGTGKTRTAEVIASILGGSLPCHADQLTSVEAATRMITDPATRVVIVDNVAPPRGSPFISSGVLAWLVTTPTLTLKELYKTNGKWTLPNSYLYIFTANKAAMSPELYSRSLICTLKPPDPWQNQRAAEQETKAWELHWTERRIEVLADMLAIALENWNRGPYHVSVPGFRFTSWLKSSARLLQAPPVLYAPSSMIRPPLEIALQRVFLQQDGPLPLSQVQYELANMKGSFEQLAQQANWEGEHLLYDMEATHVAGFVAEKVNDEWQIRKS